MNLGTAIKRIKWAAHDISDEYRREECISFLNTVIQQASAMLAQVNYHELSREVLVHENDFVPKNIIRPCGTYPLEITAGRIHLLDDDESEIRFRYITSPDNIPNEAADDYELPFKNDAINEALIRMAIVLALNQNEFNIQQDSALVAEFQNALAAAVSGG